METVADPWIFQRGVSTIKFDFQRGWVPLLFWVIKMGFHSQNALFLPFLFNFLTKGGG
jgi:hypothetical protein